MRVPIALTTFKTELFVTLLVIISRKLVSQRNPSQMLRES